MKSPAVLWVGVCVFNLALAGLMASMAPSNVGTTTDRLGYEYVSQHPLVADCPHSIYCYRVLVPTLLAHAPLPEVVAWRAFAVLANAAAGTLLAFLAVAAFGPLASAFLASIIFQTSFAATFAIFDPFTPDSAVWLLAAILAMLWWFDRAWWALGVGVVGVFAKESVALVVTAAAVAGLSGPRQRRTAWLVAAAQPGSSSSSSTPR